MGDNKPFERDYLKEAYKIYKGDRSISMKKKHIIAAMEAVVFFHSQTEGLRKLMDSAYQEAVKRRKENGLPEPVKPPSLSPGPKFE